MASTDLSKKDRSLICEICKITFEKSLPVCSKCKNVHYCSNVCQKADWSSHKKLCIKSRPGLKDKEARNPRCLCCHGVSFLKSVALVWLVHVCQEPGL
jgi:hypothetical protein